ncbi:hypothetical protein Dda_6973 [Drechslerella dactyloides]|uniref:Uncharacterized protein n=1 Tax=Drechslerella dactyloides TaxID=74499 RepID=A0AAD6IWL5_DREDA|nr:hypothetical protein Dda_6973 [Drechslerella dactyloides]
MEIPLHHHQPYPSESNPIDSKRKTKINTIKLQFWYACLEIAHNWRNQTAGGSESLITEARAGRIGDQINPINQDATARRNFKYWAMLNSDSLARHLFGRIHDTLVPEFWLSAATEMFRQNITLLAVHLGAEFTPYANGGGDPMPLAQALSTNWITIGMLGDLDFYIQGLPTQYVDSALPFSQPNTRRAGHQLYDFRDLQVNFIRQVNNLAPGAGGIGPNGLPIPARIDAIPAQITNLSERKKALYLAAGRELASVWSTWTQLNLLRPSLETSSFERRLAVYRDNFRANNLKEDIVLAAAVWYMDITGQVPDLEDTTSLFPAGSITLSRRLWQEGYCLCGLTHAVGESTVDPIEVSSGEEAAEPKTPVHVKREVGVPTPPSSSRKLKRAVTGAVREVPAPPAKKIRK